MSVAEEHEEKLEKGEQYPAYKDEASRSREVSLSRKDTHLAERQAA
jgi:hypothetical protein